MPTTPTGNSEDLTARTLRHRAAAWTRPAQLVAASLLAIATSAYAQTDAAQAAQFAELRAKARAFQYGDGVARDPLRAQETYCIAAREGDPEAQYDLGWMYANGLGFPRNDELAALFFGLAAEQGHVQARNLVRLMGDPAPDLPECMRDPILPDFVVEPPKFDSDEVFEPTTPEQAVVAELVQRIAPEYGISPRLALAVIRAESNFDPKARSPKNAQGLMQLIPETSARFNVRKPFDSAQNVRGGLAYLRWLLAYFKGDVKLAVAAYNAGERAVERYRGVPPYAETRAYVERIRKEYRYAIHPYDGSVTEPSPVLAQIEQRSPR
jgi:soluble lytic murein transglycosylase-like protein